MKAKSLLVIAILISAVACSNQSTGVPRKNDINRPNQLMTFTISVEPENVITSSDDTTVQFGESFNFVLQEGLTYNRVYINGIELLSNADQSYSIINIQHDVKITFNQQFTVELPTGDGYEFTLINHQTNIFNEGDNVEIGLKLDDDYNQSIPVVKANNTLLEAVDSIYLVEDITSNIQITISGIVMNEPEPEPTDDYSEYANTDLSWWYRVPSPLYNDVKATIDSSVFNLLSEHNATWQVNTNQKIVYLTMDEGYEFESNTSEILDIAKDKNVKITFFITGGYIDSHPDLVMRMVNEGHVVANHTDQHLRAPKALSTSVDTFINDIKRLETKYTNLTGKTIAPLYRPPEGGYSERSLAIADDLGYKTVFWSFAYRDWLTDNQPDPDEALDKMLGQLHPGSILLIHAVSDTNVEILPELIDGIRARGYTIGVLSQ